MYADPNSANLTAQKAMYYSSNQPDPTYAPDPILDFDTTYYWRVEAMEPNEVGTQEPVAHESPVWTFTTQPDEARIITDPISRTVAAGTRVEFFVTAINAQKHQWYKDGEAMNGEIGDTLILEDVQMADEGFYHCVVDNGLNLPDASEAAQLITERLVGWWKLDGDLTDAVAEAVPGAPAHDGVSTEPNFVEQGIHGGALQIAGNAESLVVVSNSAEQYNFYPQGYTVSAWVKMPPKSDAWGAYVCKQGTNPARGFIVTHDGTGKAIHTLRQMTPTDLSSSIDVDDNAWHMVTGTYDEATKVSRVYVDGILRNQIAYTGSPTVSSADLIFGAENLTASTAPYSGLLDDVHIWSYPLDMVSIAGLYVEYKTDESICVQYPDLDLAGPEGYNTPQKLGA
ncbi:MAG: hypothetical protein JW828_09565 [Sedimentisphaerales bacterium]|nr:hypothetical protein [Sedimentisphaerales bacterium]